MQDAPLRSAGSDEKEQVTQLGVFSAEDDCHDFHTAPTLVPADAIALYAKGVRWNRATGVWTPEQVKALASGDLVRGFVDEIETLADKALATNP